MKKPLPLPSQACLQLLFDYDPITGVIRRRMNSPIGKRGGVNTRAGDLATCLHKPTGYLRVCIGKSTYRANRIIWRWMTGEDPGGLVVDHQNRIRSDNRWENLRLAACRQKDAAARGVVTNQSNKALLSQWRLQGVAQTP